MQVSTVIAVHTLCGRATADFLFGASKASMQDGTIANPGQTYAWHEFMVPQGSNVCDVGDFAGDPGPDDLESQTGDEPWINWCGSREYSDDVHLTLKGPCGTDVKSGDGSDAIRGKKYADIYDDNDDGNYVGFCFFDPSGTHACAAGIGLDDRSTSIRCVTDIFGDPTPDGVEVPGL